MTDVHSLLLPLLYSGLNTPRHGTLDDPASTAIAWPCMATHGEAAILSGLAGHALNSPSKLLKISARILCYSKKACNSSVGVGFEESLTPYF
jgi:hypothetical protein